jgi:hypothetical protein
MFWTTEEPKFDSGLEQETLSAFDTNSEKTDSSLSAAKRVIFFRKKSVRSMKLPNHFRPVPKPINTPEVILPIRVGFTACLSRAMTAFRFLTLEMNTRNVVVVNSFQNSKTFPFSATHAFKRHILLIV